LRQGNKRVKEGDVFGELTVIKFLRKDKHYRNIYLCKCSCGNEKEIIDNRLLTGNTKSCGCLKKKRLTKHGLSRTKIYQVWQQMIERCYTETNVNYQKYGAKGIKVCDEWRNKDNGFINFYNWSIKNGYKEGLTIDRINTYGNYEPSNCRWTTYLTQNTNVRMLKTNTSGYIGCSYIKKSKKWRASISINNKTINLGEFESLKECVETRNNFIDENNLPHKKNVWRGELTNV
jgi:hypothetical protein